MAGTPGGFRAQGQTERAAPSGATASSIGQGGGATPAQLGEVAKVVGGAIAKVVEGVNTANASSAMGLLAEAASSLASKLKPAFDALPFSLDQVKGRLRQLAVTMAQPMAALELLGKGLGDTLSNLLGPLKGVGEAAWQIMQPFQQLAGSIQPFVSALNPALAKAIEFSLRELQATFGLLVQPIGQVLAPLIREVAATLQPVFRQMAPLVGQFAQAIGRAVAMVSRVFAGSLQSLMPVLEASVKMYASVVEALSPLAVLAKTLAEELGPLWLVYIKAITPVVQAFARAVVVATAALLRLVGATGALDSLLKAMRDVNKPGPQSGGLQAAQNVQWTSSAEYGRSLALAATVAAQTSPDQAKKDPSELMLDLIQSVEMIRQGEIGSAISREVEAAIRTVWTNTIWPAISAAGKAAYSTAESTANLAGAAATVGPGNLAAAYAGRYAAEVLPNIFGS